MISVIRRPRQASLLRALSAVAVAALVLAACAGEAPAPGTDGDGDATAGTEAVSFRLNWVIAGNHAPFFYAQQEEFWSDCGLDVDIQAGSGSGDTAQLVGTGGQDFGLTDGASIVPGRVEGMPIVSLGVLYQENPSSLVSKAETGLTELEDIEGHTFGAVPGGSPYLLYEWVVENQGIDRDSIEEVSIPAPGIAQLEADQVDFITYFGNEVANIDPNPEENLNVIELVDYGLESYGLAITTSESIVEENPEAAACFVDGILQGLEGAQDDPQAALDALFAASPEAAEDPEVHEQLLDGIWPWVGDDPLAQDVEGWDATQNELREAGIVDDTVDPASFIAEF